MEICYTTQETQIGTLNHLEGWMGNEMGGRFKTEGNYAWFMLRFDRKQKNSVNQLSFNKIFFKKIRS